MRKSIIFTIWLILLIVPRNADANVEFLGRTSMIFGGNWAGLGGSLGALAPIEPNSDATFRFKLGGLVSAYAQAGYAVLELNGLLQPSIRIPTGQSAIDLRAYVNVPVGFNLAFCPTGPAWGANIGILPGLSYQIGEHWSVQAEFGFLFHAQFQAPYTNIPAGAAQIGVAYILP